MADDLDLFAGRERSSSCGCLRPPGEDVADSPVPPAPRADGTEEPRSGDQAVVLCAAVSAVSASAAARSALMLAPASAPAAAAGPTWAVGSVAFPATHTPGTSVVPAGPEANRL